MARALATCALLIAAAAAVHAGEWAPCGGLNGPNKDDAPGIECPTGFSCVRQDA